MNTISDYPISSNKSNIREIYFEQMEEEEMQTLYDNATLKLDLTYNNEGKVLAWLTPDTIDNTKYILHIASDGKTFLTTGNELFYYFNNVEKIDFGNVDTSRVTIMKGMFKGCQKLDNIDISSFNTSNVTDMQYMFKDCRSLTTINFGNIDTSSVINMSSVFQYCESLVSIDLSNFNTNSVSTMYGLFESCSNLKTVSLSGLGSNDLTGYLYMFINCNKIESIDMSYFNFGTTNLTNLFDSLQQLLTVDLSNANISGVTNMYSLFGYDSSLTTIYVSNDWNVENVTSSSNMFYECTSIVGGNGTTYDNTKVDKTMAIIDNNDQEGYLTLKNN